MRHPAWWRTAIIWYNGNLVYWRIYVALGLDVDGLLQERRNSIAKTLELRLSRINPSMCRIYHNTR